MTARILVINDDAGGRTLFDLALSNEGYEVLTARDGEEGLDSIRTFAPDLILLDMRMPNINGETFIEQYMEMTGRKVPVIAFSAAIGEKEHALQHGADDFLSLPFNIADLLRLVEKQLQRTRSSE